MENSQLEKNIEQLKNVIYEFKNREVCFTGFIEQCNEQLNSASMSIQHYIDSQPQSSRNEITAIISLIYLACNNKEGLLRLSAVKNNEIRINNHFIQCINKLSPMIENTTSLPYLSSVFSHPHEYNDTVHEHIKIDKIPSVFLSEPRIKESVKQIYLNSKWDSHLIFLKRIEETSLFNEIIETVDQHATWKKIHFLHVLLKNNQNTLTEKAINFFKEEINKDYEIYQSESKWVSLQPLFCQNTTIFDYYKTKIDFIEQEPFVLNYYLNTLYTNLDSVGIAKTSEILQSDILKHKYIPDFSVDSLDLAKPFDFLFSHPTDSLMNDKNSFSVDKKSIGFLFMISEITEENIFNMAEIDVLMDGIPSKSKKEHNETLHLLMKNKQFKRYQKDMFTRSLNQYSSSSTPLKHIGKNNTIHYFINLMRSGANNGFSEQVSETFNEYKDHATYKEYLLFLWNALAYYSTDKEPFGNFLREKFMDLIQLNVREKPYLQTVSDIAHNISDEKFNSHAQEIQNLFIILCEKDFLNRNTFSKSHTIKNRL